jgi:flagellar motor switch protein FliN/FliY
MPDNRTDQKRAGVVEESSARPASAAGRAATLKTLAPKAPVEGQGLSPEDLDAVLRAAGGSPPGVDVVAAPSTGAGQLDLLKDVALDVRIELGRTHMRLEDVLRLGAGAVVALDRLAGDPVDVLVNGQLIARGEVMVLDENFCVRVTEILAPADHANGSRPGNG